MRTGWSPGKTCLSATSPQDGCGANSQPTFKILTENVVCGKSGVTCSRAIRISLGVSGQAGVPIPQPPSPRSSLLVPLDTHFPCPGLICTMDSSVSRSWAARGGVFSQETDSARGAVSTMLWNLLPRTGSRGQAPSPELALSRHWPDHIL